jgi:hypothetical protein
VGASGEPAKMDWTRPVAASRAFFFLGRTPRPWHASPHREHSHMLLQHWLTCLLCVHR